MKHHLVVVLALTICTAATSARADAPAAAPPTTAAPADVEEEETVPETPAKTQQKPAGRSWARSVLDIGPPVLPAPRTALAAGAWGLFGAALFGVVGLVFVGLPTIVIVSLAYGTFVGGISFLYGLLLGGGNANGLAAGVAAGMFGFGAGGLYGLVVSVPMAFISVYSAVLNGAATMTSIGVFLDTLDRLGLHAPRE
ncbi:MAG: hypothetical protein AB2A00_10760 [Myxococcota bacterium]